MRIYLSPPEISDDSKRLLNQTLESGWISPYGDAVNQFESALAEYHDVKHAVTCSSGTASLHLILHALNLPKGAVVFLPALNYAGVVHPVIHLDLTPWFVDVDDYGQLSVELLKFAIGESIQKGLIPGAIIAVDLLGWLPDYEAIERICITHNIPLVSDAAESIGATFKGKKTGTFGVAGLLSFNGNKIVTASAGGAVLTNHDDLANRIRLLKNHSRSSSISYDHTEPGYNYQFSNVLSALGLGEFRRMQQMLDKRVLIAKRYKDILENRSDASIELVDWKRRDTEPNYWLNAFIIPDKDNLVGISTLELCKKMIEIGIELRPIWKPLHLHSYLQHYPATLNGQSEKFHKSVVCLPSGSQLTESDQVMIIDELCHLL